MSGITIGEAKIKVLNKNPFFGSILMHLPVIETDEVPTLGVDGDFLYVNVKYWESLNQKQKYAALMHEAGHLFLRHLWRGKNFTDVAVDPTTGQAISLFNLAGDAVINIMISEDSRFELGKDWFFDKKYVGMATEEVYHDLRKNMKQMTQKQMEDLLKKMGASARSGCDKSKWGNGTPKERKQQEQKWTETMKQAAEYARQRGYEPAWLKRLYDELNPKEDWRAVLREYIQPFQSDYAFNPADRRYMESDFVLPDIQDGEKLDWVAIAVDTSGSIADKELNNFIGELKGIMSAYDSVRVKLTFCDTEATPFVELKDFDADKNQIKVSGGGGTDFSMPFALVKKEENPPLLMIYMTDLQGSFPKDKPEYDTIWLTIQEYKGTPVPFGKILPYRIT